MRWLSHALIGGSVCAVFEPSLLPWAVLGSTAPDWLEWVGRNHRPLHRAAHRDSTHTLLGWLLCALVGGLIGGWGRALVAFAAGGILHWLGDALTVTGAPLTWWSQHRSTLFGGRMRQGSKTERAIAWGLAITCAVWLVLRHQASPEDRLPFVIPWTAHYQSGLLDAAEWHRHRFSPF